MELIHQQARLLLSGSAGREYDIYVYARSVDDSWEGWLEFHPRSGGLILKTTSEVTQPTREALHLWAMALEADDFERAFERAFDNCSHSNGTRSSS